MDAIGTDNANKTVLFLLLIGLLVFCIYTLTFRPFSCCVLFTVSFNKRKSVIINFSSTGRFISRENCLYMYIFMYILLQSRFLLTFKLF